MHICQFYTYQRWFKIILFFRYVCVCTSFDIKCTGPSSPSILIHQRTLSSPETLPANLLNHSLSPTLGPPLFGLLALRQYLYGCMCVHINLMNPHNNVHFNPLVRMCIWMCICGYLSFLILLHHIYMYKYRRA